MENVNKEEPRAIALEKLKEIQGNKNTEVAHEEADDVLSELLIALGYQDVVTEYRKVYKWYA